MKGITFGNMHSHDDLNLILNSKEIGSPVVKIKKVDIPGADSSLDLTEFFGEVKFDDVRHKFNFSSIAPQTGFLSIFSTVKNALHGKKMRITLDDDPQFFYRGRCFVSSFTNEKNIGIISVECDCEPYKYKIDPTVVRKTISGSGSVTLLNSAQKTVPVITTTASLTISFGGFSTARSAGTFTVPEFELSEGSNIFNVTGTGTITFTYQEGTL